MIVIESYSGLGSRIHTVTQAIDLAMRYQQTLTIIWDKDESCYCDFEELFDTEKLFAPLNTPWKVYNRYYLLYSERDEIKHGRIISNLPKILRYSGNNILYEGWKLLAFRGKFYDLAPMDDILRYQRFDSFLENISNGRNGWVKTYNDLDWNLEPGRRGQLTRTIRFREDLLEEAHSIISGSYISVHIRRTDHKQAIACSPTSLYVDRMKEELRRDDSVRFFVASDDDREIERLRTEFGDRIVTNEKKIYGRNTEDSIRSAAVDLICLAGGRKILAPYTSQFSTAAVEYGNIPIEWIHI